MSNWPEWFCPKHKKLLDSRREGLVCPDGDLFLYKNEIPRFVEKSDYADTFGKQWRRYRRTQLDSYTGFSITRDRIYRCIGEDLWNKLSGKQVLECGCGAGRFTEILLNKGCYVTSIDLSDAVEANQENFPQSENHRIAQADILRLPFAAQQFDIVFCCGVIQHTPNPEQTIKHLYVQVKPGGTLVFDHYTYSLSFFTKIASLLRFYFRQLPPGKGIRYTEQLVNLLLPFHKIMRNFYPAQILLNRVSPVSCYYHAYPQLSDELQRQWALLDTYDFLTAWYSHLRKRSQIFRVLKSLGMEKIWCEYGGNGIEVHARRSDG